MSLFGTLHDGREVHCHTISSERVEAQILPYGARLHRISLDGGPNAMAGSEDLKGYMGELAFSGPIVGPVANRIKGARAQISDQWHTFDANQDGRHSLHSGTAGVHAKLWDVESHGADRVTLTCHLEDGEGGFPGNRTLRAAYRTEGADLCLDLSATTDAPTLMNLAHHGVWNLDGAAEWAGHRLQVPTARYLPTDGDTLPTGEIAAVPGTPYDHQEAVAPDPSLDHNFCFDPASDLRRLALLTAPSGRFVEVLSDAPGLQVFAGKPRGIALEPQLWPDAPANPAFPSILLTPDAPFRQRNRFRLG